MCFIMGFGGNFVWRLNCVLRSENSRNVTQCLLIIGSREESLAN